MAGTPKPYNQSISRILSPSALDASFFREVVPKRGLSKLVTEFPAVMSAFLTLGHTQRGSYSAKGRVSVGSQHPSPNVKTFCNFEPQIWLEIITSLDAKSACLKVRGRHVER